MIANYDIIRKHMQNIILCSFEILNKSNPVYPLQIHNSQGKRMDDPIIDDVKVVRGYQPDHGRNGTSPFLGMTSNMTKKDILNDCNLTSNLMNMQRQGNYAY